MTLDDKIVEKWKHLPLRYITTEIGFGVGGLATILNDIYTHQHLDNLGPNATECAILMYLMGVTIEIGTELYRDVKNEIHGQ